MVKRVLRYWPALLALLLAGIADSCATTQEGSRGPSPVVVTGDLARLREGDLTAIVFQPFIVEVNPGDTIWWVNELDASLTILFGPPTVRAQVPVGVDTLLIQAGERGYVVVELGADTTIYKYGARVGAGPDAPTVDPYIDIQPPPGAGD